MREWRIGILLVFVLISGGALATFTRAHTHDDWPVPDEAKKVKNPIASDATSIAAGKDLFMKNCAKCHGEKGKGDGDQAMMYDPMPSDFTDVHMMNEMSDGEIFWKMTEGRRPMPSFKKELTDEQRWQLVNFLRTFAPKPMAPPAKSPGKSPAKH
jgi:mono/diheme cytochrome c family protein